MNDEERFTNENTQDVKPVIADQMSEKTEANATIKQFNPEGILDVSLGLLSHVSLRNSDGAGNETIYVVFWPQLLEFVGFGMLLGLVVWLVRYKS